MENKNNSLVWWIVGVIVIAGFITWIVSANQAAPAPAETATTTADATLQAPESVEDLSVGSVDASTAIGANPAGISYGQALIAYANRRIQLDSKCQAEPNQVTYKNNTNIMIDNRSAIARTVHVGNYYPIKAFGFKVINLSLAKLPGTFYLDCGTGQNEATILIQK